MGRDASWVAYLSGVSLSILKTCMRKLTMRAPARNDLSFRHRFDIVLVDISSILLLNPTTEIAGSASNRPRNFGDVSPSIRHLTPTNRSISNRRCIDESLLAGRVQFGQVR